MIEALRNFFDINDALVFLIYGQVFFIMGLAIALQSRRHSRLELARSLRWLSAFGITHGLHEWGLFFIPIQAAYLSDTILTIMQWIQLLLLALSFAFLFQFGADLLRDRWPWLLRVPLLVTLAWGLWALFTLLSTDISMGLWFQRFSVLARYMLGFPGALVAAYGMRYQAEHRIKPLNLTHIYQMLRIGGIALATYAVLAGLVVPFADFFPARWLNDSLPVLWLGVPVAVFRSITGLAMAVAIIRAMEVFDLEVDRLIERMEIEGSLAAERERIGRELHDGAIQQVYTAGLILESARAKVEHEGVIGQRLDRAMTALNQAIASLRAYMQELRPGPTELSLVEGLREQAADPRLSALMDVDLVLEIPEAAVMDPVRTTHVLAIVSEALSNAARHAQARHVEVHATREDHHFSLTIVDDGQGFSSAQNSDGYGLRNMRDRARLLGGTLAVDSSSGKGTRVTLLFPWEES